MWAADALESPGEAMAGGAQWAAARAAEEAAVRAGCRVARSRDLRASRRSADITMALLAERRDVQGGHDRPRPGHGGARP